MTDRRVFPVDMESYFREPEEDEYANYPEPTERPRALFSNEELERQNLNYIKALNEFVDELSKHVRTLQDEENKKMSVFNNRLKEQSSRDNTTTKKKPDERDDVRAEFSTAISGLRRSRKAYKEMIKEALTERQKFLDSYKLQNEMQEEVSTMYRKLKLSDRTSASARSHGRELTSFFGILVALQVAFFLIAFAIFQYRSDTSNNNGGSLRADDYFSYFIHISLMVVFGFGYLSVYLQKYSFGAICLNFLAAAFSFQWALANLALWKNIKLNPTSFNRLDLTIEVMIQMAYTAGAVVISLGSLCGKLTAIETIILAFWEIIFFSLNRYIIIDQLQVVDPGGAIYIHLFAAFFALGAGYFVSRQYQDVFSSKKLINKLTSSSYLGDVLTLIATIVIWVLFPSWNAALAPDGSQHRVIVNTLLSLCSSTASALFTSRTLRGRYYHVRDIQHATLAGGIAMASGHAALIYPGSAMIVGSLAGIGTVMGLSVLRSWLESRSPLKFHDTRGVFVLHGFSGLLGGLASVVACATTYETSIFGLPERSLFPNGLPAQGGYQGVGIIITMAIAFFSGLVASIGIHFLRKVVPHHTKESIFSDRREFHVPSGYVDLEFREP